MGNYKFRLADMMPNAWFYKLRDVSKKTSNKPQTQKLQPPDQKTMMENKKTKKKRKNSTFPNNSSSSSPSSRSTMTTTTTTTVSSTKPNPPYQRSPRKSYYFTRDLTSRVDHRNSNPNSNSSSPPEENPTPLAHSKNSSESPRRSSSLSIRTRKTRSSARQCQKQFLTKSGCAGAATLDSVWGSPSSEYSSSSPAEEEEYSGGRESRSDRILATTQTGVATTTKTRAVTDRSISAAACWCEERETGKENDVAAKEFDSLAKLELPPIATKARKKEKISSINRLAQRTVNKPNSIRNNNSGSPGIRLRINNSPRIASRRVSGLRKSWSESFAVVKSSFDPQRDFRESMVEMIVENNIRASKDLEDLLACYLSLNSDEYHGVIINVFKQIWFDLTNISN